MDQTVGIKRVGGRAPPAAAPPAKRVAGAAPAAGTGGGTYDPSRPNDYDAYVKERNAVAERAREEENMKVDRQQWEEREAVRMQALRSEKDAGLTASADDAFKRRLEMSKSIGSRKAEELEERQREEEAAAAKIKAETEPKLSFAERMLRKQGWKGDGQGLGKNQQGMAAALEVAKTAGNQGVIQQAAGPMPRGGPSRKKGGTKLQGNPSKVILLRNMVRPGQVDGTLRREVAQECSRYGEVRAVQIYEELKDAALPPEERVRLFVKFERVPEAMKAVVELDGRTFDNRVISSCFYDENKFDLSILAPQAEDPALPAECRT